MYNNFAQQSAYQEQNEILIVTVSWVWGRLPPRKTISNGALVYGLTHYLVTVDNRVRVPDASPNLSPAASSNENAQLSVIFYRSLV